MTHPKRERDDDSRREAQIGRVTRIVCLLIVAAYLVWIAISSRFEGVDTSDMAPLNHQTRQVELAAA
jgi:hypothetical protein